MNKTKQIFLMTYTCILYLHKRRNFSNGNRFSITRLTYVIPTVSAKTLATKIIEIYRFLNDGYVRLLTTFSPYFYKHVHATLYFVGVNAICQLMPKVTKYGYLQSANRTRRPIKVGLYSLPRYYCITITEISQYFSIKRPLLCIKDLSGAHDRRIHWI